MSEDDVNEPWELADLVDALAAEVDRAEDTLALKSRARQVTFALKSLSLDLAVEVRHTPDGRLEFRTTRPESAGGTMLHLDLAKVLDRQLQGARKELDIPHYGVDLSGLEGITERELIALRRLSIFSLGDLMRSTRTAAMLAEVSRQTGIEETRLRRWADLPYLDRLEPDRGVEGMTVRLLGGNLGPGPEPGDRVLFQGHDAEIAAWSDTEIRAYVPGNASDGVVVALAGGSVTNPLSWRKALEPEEYDGVEVEVNVTGSASWIRVTVDGQNVLEGWQGSGFSETFEADREVELRISDAAQVSLVVNGEDQGILGQSGEVVDLHYSAGDTA